MLQLSTCDMGMPACLRREHIQTCHMAQVHGGVDLRLGNRSSPKHRRVPSEEALLKMAAQHNSPIPFPTVFSPIPEDYDSTVQQLQHQQQQQQQQQLQQQRPPSRSNQATTFAERLNGFLTGVGSHSGKSAEPIQPAPLMGNTIGRSPAQLSEVRHAQMAVSGSNAGYTGDTTTGAIESAARQSLEADMDRVGSGDAASTSGDPLDTAYSGPAALHGAREKARNEAIAVYGERCELVFFKLYQHA